MQIRRIHYQFFAYLLLFIPLSVFSYSNGLFSEQSNVAGQFSNNPSSPMADILLAQNNTAENEKNKSYINQEFVDYDNEIPREKKQNCMVICEQWGNDCVIDAKNGAQSCRQVCQQFGQECF